MRRLPDFWEDDFYTWLGKRGTSTISIKAYQNDLGRYRAWFLGQNGTVFLPALLTGVDLRAWRRHSLEIEAVRPATWNHRRATMMLLATWARQVGLILGDPMDGVQPALEERVIRWIAPEDQRAILRQLEIACNGATTPAWREQAVRDQAMVMLMVMAGLRVAEVVALDVEDVIMSERKGEVVVRRGKRDKFRRVPLAYEVRRALDQWINLAQLVPGMPLFPGKGSVRITTRSVQRRVVEIKRLAGVDHLTPHMLRHTFGHSLIGNSPITVVKKLMGHSRISTTERYVEPGWRDLEAAVEKIGG